MANIFEKNKTYLGDCLELMPQMETGMFDMILCDLPYGTTACKWDTIIPFDKLWEQYERIIKPNGAIVLFSSQPFTTNLINSNIDKLKYTLVWEKTIASNFIRAEKEPLKLHEDICVFSYGVIKYNYLLEDKEKKNIRNTKSENVAQYKEGHQFYGRGSQKYNEKRKIPTNKKYSGSVLKQISVGNNNPNRIHPTQKPVELFERLLHHYSNEGELILDNCAGSGTTAEACYNTGRDYIQIEKEQKYFDLILGREKSFNKKDYEQKSLFGGQM